MIKAVIFDFDGTIIDTESAWFEIYQLVLKEKHGFDLTLDEFVKVVGTTDGALFDFIDESLEFPMDRDLFMSQVEMHFAKIKDQLVLRDGFLESLKNIKRHGVELAVASSSKREWVLDFLTIHGLADCFSIICTAEDVEEVKPDPALYVKTLEKLGIEAHEALAIEDSYNGSIAAINAGIQCLIIPNDVTRSLTFHEKGHLLHSYADFKIEDYLKDPFIEA